MKLIPSGIAGVAVAAGLLLVLSSLASTPPPPPTPTVYGATLTFVDGSTIILQADDRFESINLAPSETVTIAVQMPPAFANAPASAQALDGGSLSADDIVIGADGTASIAFQAGAPPGRYRLLLGSMGLSATLQFQVVAQ